MINGPLNVDQYALRPHLRIDQYRSRGKGSPNGGYASPASSVDPSLVGNAASPNRLHASMENRSSGSDHQMIEHHHQFRKVLATDCTEQNVSGAIADTLSARDVTEKLSARDVTLSSGILKNLIPQEYTQHEQILNVGEGQEAGAGQSKNNTYNLEEAMRMLGVEPSTAACHIPSGRSRVPIEMNADDTRDPDYGELADSRCPLWAHALKHDMQALFKKEFYDLLSTLKQDLQAMFLTKTHETPSWAVALKTDMQATIREGLPHMYERRIQPGLKKDIKDATSQTDGDTDDEPKDVPMLHRTREKAAAMEAGRRQVDSEASNSFVRFDVATPRPCDSTLGEQSSDVAILDRGGCSKATTTGETIRVRNELAALGFSNKKHWASYNIRVERMVQKFIDSTSDVKEPEHDGLAGCIVASKSFEIVCTCVIALNSIFVATTSNFAVQNFNKQRPDWMSITEKSFTVFYIIEWLIRLSAHQCWFFFNRWNIFDTVVVAISVIDLVSETLFHAGSEGKNLVVMRVLRFLKLSKLLRTVRALRFFSDLMVMLESFGQSASAFFWALVAVFFLFYVGSLVFLQGVGEYLASLDPTAQGFAAHVSEVRSYFGSVYGSMLTLFQTCTGGNEWRSLYTVLEKVGIIYAWLLVFLIFFWEFVFLNVVTGIAVEKAAGAARPGRDDLVLNQRLHVLSAKKEFKHLCKLFDPANTGMISYDIFKKQMENDVLLSYLESVGLEVHEIDTFFQIVAGDGCQDRVSIDRFVDGCMHMKGDASGIDMQKAIFQISLVHEDLGKVMKQNAMIMKSIQTTQCVMNFDQ